jgi:hypothetical protein
MKILGHLNERENEKRRDLVENEKRFLSPCSGTAAIFIRLRLGKDDW